MANSSYIGKRIFDQNLRKKFKPLLRFLDIELTERCNNNCLHCCINLSKDNLSVKDKELSTKEIKSILEEAVSLGCFSIRLTGGEPLLREDFAEIYLFARKLKLRVVIFTNATLISPDLAKLFSKTPPLEKIEVTVYGMSKDSYESVTLVEGSFAAAFKGINLLLRENVPFIVKGAVLSGHAHELNEFEKWSKGIPWMKETPSYTMLFNLRCRREEQRNKLIRKVRFAPDDILKLLLRHKKDYLQMTKDVFSRSFKLGGERVFLCDAGDSTGCVDAYGYFYPCMVIRDPKCAYLLRKGSLKDALENFFPQIRQMKASNPKYLEHCAKCFLREFCEQCPGFSWTDQGDLDTPVDYLCEVAHFQARFLGLLKQEEKAWDLADWEKRLEKFIHS